MEEKIRPIEEMTSLFNRLNKGTIAKIRNARKQAPVKPLKAPKLINPIIHTIQGYNFNQLPKPAQDVLLGACRTASDGNRSLDPDCLLACYQALPEFYTASIASFLECSESNAKKYFQALRIANLFMRRIYDV